MQKYDKKNSVFFRFLFFVSYNSYKKNQWKTEKLYFSSNILIIAI